MVDYSNDEPAKMLPMSYSEQRIKKKNFKVELK